MGLLDSFEDENAAALDDLVRRPLPQAPQATKFSAWKALSAAPRGLAAAGLETMAMVPDVAQAVGGAFTTTTADMLPEPRAQGGAEFRAREKQRAKDQAASSLEGDTLRQASKPFMPDPATAHGAERVVFDFAKFGGKAIGSVVTAGPAGGAALLGLNEGLTTADDLKDKGVDLTTRTQVGAVAGVVSALGVALPVAGKGVAQTVGLVAVGGPGSMVAQQVATREILQAADYSKLADQIDPFDPVGLAVSTLVPAGFGAWALRGAKIKTKAGEIRLGEAAPAPTKVAPAAEKSSAVAPTPDQVDAARVEMLTQHVEKSTPTGGNDPAAWRAHDQAFSRAMDQLARGERVHVSDVAPVVRMQALEDFVKTSGIKAERLPPSVDGSFLAWLRDRGGVDFAAKRDVTGEGGGITANPAGIFRNGGIGLDELARMAEADGYLTPGAVASELDNGGTRALADLIQRATSGERVLTLLEQVQKAQRDSAERSMQERLEAVEQRLRAAGIDPAPARGNVDALEAYEQANRLRIFAAAMDEARSKMDTEGGAEYEVMSGRAAQIAQDIAESSRTVAQYEAEVTPLSAVMRAMVQRNLDAANAQAAPQAGSAATPSAPPQTQPQTATAPSPGPASPGEQGGGGVSRAGGDATEAAVVSQRLAEIQQQFPDLSVQMDGMDKPVRLADFLEQVQREAMEGNDFDIGGNDAPLMQVAASCFLVNG